MTAHRTAGSTPGPTPVPATGVRPGVRRAAGALSGPLATGAALGAGELCAGLLRPGARPVTVVGGAVIDSTPAPVKEWAIATFGAADKVVLQLGVVVVLIGCAVGLGLLSSRRRVPAVLGAFLFGAAVAVIALSRPASTLSDTVPSLVAGVAGAGALWWLSGRLRPVGGAGSVPAPTGASPWTPVREEGAAPIGPRTGPAGAAASTGAAEFDRRGFLAAASVTAAASAGAGLLGRRLSDSGAAEAEAARDAVSLPAPDLPAGPLPAGIDPPVTGLTPFITPNRDFYRVDTALTVPRVDATTWRLRLHGLGMSREVTLDYRNLLRRELVERDITLTCVSNEVGGPYTGNARWIGVRLAELLREAGVRAPSEGGPADQLISRSVDGMTIGTPVEAVLDGREALLAVGMNGEPLPFRNGFPVRMVVPGLYGYVSACKWLEELELTTFAEVDAYWVRRQWAAEAPIKTQSRIDTPRPFARVGAGTVAVAGVAWAQTRGIERVEVRVDDGPWQEAVTADVPHTDTWRQWFVEWRAEPGSHRLEVRATDGTGDTQTPERVGISPDGASGWHSVVVTVE
ncbi:molybdopterin-dependent oxidoreductase [Streptomyces sp. ST2-7A]|uniref:molybdopterin-dependent oxidoreductase n=1 Tax=Streptomyces sp. ST2-7A TaxID=2907214 RepID=UPI001F3BBBFD|nr:molybdopterin-dependent oxidoreductase [Streptomyces sp. ST2-7A]MCE7081646.1 molybdopterin-dependent oxidoreductase [Streptomyces sp. ST2-7A]